MNTTEKPQEPIGYHKATVADMVECLRGWEEPSLNDWKKCGKWNFCQQLIKQYDARGSLSPKQIKILREYWVIYWYRPTHKRYFEELEKWEAAR